MTHKGMLMRVSIPLIALFTIGILITSFVHAQPPFDVSPGEFTIENVPIGEAYSLEKLKNLVIRNYENIEREFIISVVKPPENEVREGYEPIPENTWMFTQPAFLVVEENSSAVVKMILDIPAQENLTNKRWEAWIQIRREPKPELGETLAVTLNVRAKIVTAGELPPRIPVRTLAILLIVVVIAAVIVGFLAWHRGRPMRARKRK